MRMKDEIIYLPRIGNVKVEPMVGFPERLKLYKIYSFEPDYSYKNYEYIYLYKKNNDLYIKTIKYTDLINEHKLVQYYKVISFLND